MKKLNLIFAICISFITLAQKRDSLFIPYPEKYQLTLKYHQENNEMIFREWIPKNETLEKYSIIATTITFKDMAKVPLDTYKDYLFNNFQQNTINPIFTEIKRGENFIIFKSEVDYYKKAPRNKEAQLYYIRKGKKDLFSSIIAIKEKHLPEKFVKEWTEIFLNSKIIE